ncbi:4768_t:CDS:2 [Acaulospora morrowiae]|uniref:4768_t:CDS:1 n=1 Tax=Acaulospora morrowiae TaxID=94023 RepID=A0A9N8VG28_9GLOM|nr:4768_t:CDS:2 [Acaulospora morrowiae]
MTQILPTYADAGQDFNGISSVYYSSAWYQCSGPQPANYIGYAVTVMKSPPSASQVIGDFGKNQIINMSSIPENDRDGGILVLTVEKSSLKDITNGVLSYIDQVSCYTPVQKCRQSYKNTSINSFCLVILNPIEEIVYFQVSLRFSMMSSISESSSKLSLDDIDNLKGLMAILLIFSAFFIACIIAIGTCLYRRFRRTQGVHLE